MMKPLTLHDRRAAPFLPASINQEGLATAPDVGPAAAPEGTAAAPSSAGGGARLRGLSPSGGDSAPPSERWNPPPGAPTDKLARLPYVVRALPVRFPRPGAVAR